MLKHIESDVTISSRVRLARNFEGYPFPLRLSNDKSYEVIEKVKKTIISDNLPKFKFRYVEMGSLDPISKLMLMERHLISSELFSTDKPAGLIVSDDEKVGIMINEEDHLRIQCLADGMNLYETLSLSMEIEEAIERENNFAFNHRYGYLTTCPTNVGTGMRASVMLHLPALTMTGNINEVIQACIRLGLTARGMYGENSEVVGNMFQISNQKTLGQNEESIINNVTNIVNQIIEQEKKVRIELLSKNQYRFEDKVQRAYGILKSARIMSSEESMRLLSDVRLGVDLKIINDISKEKINYLQVAIQPGSLQKSAGIIIEEQERDIYRAVVIRKILESDGLN